MSLRIDKTKKRESISKELNAENHAGLLVRWPPDWILTESVRSRPGRLRLADWKITIIF